jgi:molecular chaperone DnaK
MGRVLGIDLGTSNSVVAVIEGDQPVIVSNSEGSHLTPSVVAYTKYRDCLVGGTAKRQMVANPQNTFYSVKRLIGRKYNEVESEINQVSYRSLQGRNSNIILDCPILDQHLTPEFISAQILRKLVDDANRYLGTEISQAVITVPAYFSNTQRQSTRAAGRMAGLEVLRIINEPTAASLAYCLCRNIEGNVLIFDLGGGTLDVSLLEVHEGVFKVLATAGDNRLGGDDFTRRLANWLINSLSSTQGVDLSGDAAARQRLLEAAEKAKIDLSTLFQTEVILPFVTLKGTTPIGFEKTVTREQLENLCSDLITRCQTPIMDVLQYSRGNPINHVVMVGGSTRIPAIQNLVRQLTGKNINLDINPEEVVAAGAALQANVLSGYSKDIVLCDITAMDLGIEVSGGRMLKLIPKNTPIPCSVTRKISTARDNQTRAKVHVLQGESQLVKDNISLGTFHLEGIPLAPKGFPKIQVQYDIDVNGILTVTATNGETGRTKLMTVELNYLIQMIEQGIDELPVEKQSKAKEYLEAIKSEVSMPKSNLSNIESNVKSLSEIAKNVAEIGRNTVVFCNSVMELAKFVGWFFI